MAAAGGAGGAASASAATTAAGGDGKMKMEINLKDIGTPPINQSIN